jgi:phosphoglycolate phosphatase
MVDLSRTPAGPFTTEVCPDAFVSTSTFGRMIRRLILWDVDGTLVRAGEIGAVVFDRALSDVFGCGPAQRIRMSGKTDPQIVIEYLDQMKIESSEHLMEAILSRLDAHLAIAHTSGELVAEGFACPGVAKVLEEMSGDVRVVSSLLTGNIYPNAAAKVTAFGLDCWLQLDVGAYGSDHHDRNALVPVAVSRVQDKHGVVLRPEEVWVVGDTPLDLGCARVAGARCLLVATGRYTFEELSPLGADAVLEDFSDAAAALEILLGDL